MSTACACGPRAPTSPSFAAGSRSSSGGGGSCNASGVRRRPEAAHLSIVRGVLEELKLRHVGGLRFSPTLSAETLQAFLRVFHAERTENASDAIEAAIDRGRLHGIRLIPARS